MGFMQKRAEERINPTHVFGCLLNAETLGLPNLFEFPEQILVFSKHDGQESVNTRRSGFERGGGVP